MKHSKRVISVVLCLAVFLSLVLTGCGDKDKDNSKAGDEFVYVSSYLKPSQTFEDGINQVRFVNGKFYFMAYVLPDGISQEEIDKQGRWNFTEQRLFTMDMDGNATLLPGYQQEKLEEGVDGYIGNRGMDVDADGNIYVLTEKSIYQFDLPAGFDENTDYKWDYYVGEDSSYKMEKLDPEGNLLGEVDLSAVLTNSNVDDGYRAYINNFMVSSNDYIYLAMDRKLCVLDTSGALVYTYESDSWVESTLKLADGSVCFTCYVDSEDGGGYQMFKVDPVGKKVEAYCEKMPNSAWNLQPGTGDYAAFYTSGAYLYGLKIADGVATEETILNWINCDIDSSYVRAFAVNEDDSVVCITEDYSGETTKTELAKLVKTPAKDVQQKETLTLAMQYLDYDAKRAVLNFNKTNPDYRIEIRDYSEYNTEDDYEAGVKKLTTEILSGDMPDIVYTSGLPIQQMAGKGLLEDLYPFMEQDSVVKKENFIPKVLEAMETDGKLYTTCSSFQIMTVMGNKDVVGDKTSWTMDEFRMAYDSMPDGCTVFDQYVTRSDIMQYMLMMNESKFVDWANNSCSFDSQEFIDLLEFVSLFPSEFDWENYDYDSSQSTQARIATGQQMLMMASMYDFWDAQYNMLSFGNNGTYIGFPTSDGSSGNVLMLGDGYAISSKCSNKEAAWQFVRQFMGANDDMYRYGFSPIQKTFDEALKEAMTPRYKMDENGNYILDENGNKIEESQGGFSDGVNSYEIYSMTQEQADQLINLINSCENVMYGFGGSTDGLTDIVNEESEAYFNGQKSAEETAKMVQSRASLYVKEQG